MIKFERKSLVTLVAMAALGWAWQRHLRPSHAIERVTRGAPRVARLDQVPSGPSSHQEASADRRASDPARADNDTDELSKARSLVDIGNIQEAVAAFEKILRANPSDTKALMELAMVYILDLKDSAAARPLLEQVVAAEPDHRAALRELEVVYRELNRLEEGLDFLRLKAQQNPDSTELRFAYGNLLADKNPAEAISWLQSAATAPELREESLDAIAAIAISSGNRELARKTLSESLRISEERLRKSKERDEAGIDYLEDRIAGTKKQLQDLAGPF